MDPVGSIDIDTDTTFVLALEAQERGYGLFFFEPRDLHYRDGDVRAFTRRLTLRREHGKHFTLGERTLTNLVDLDVILMRQDPPFDMSYITATHLLQKLRDQVCVVNDPETVRNAPEKLFVTEFRELMPSTLITASSDAVISFRAQHGDIVIKPLYGNGGEGVIRVREDDENLSAILEMFARMYREPFIVQQYLPEVRDGDKRIILVDGEPVGAINRIPPKGEARSNMHAGGKPVKSDLTTRDREICNAIGPDLRNAGLIFVGIDVIGDCLTEINVTSPTGIQEINRFDGVRLEALVWDAIESRLEN